MLTSDDYAAAIEPARQRFAEDPAVAALFSGAMERQSFFASLLYFNVLGISMTEPVERWTHRAGVRCEELGMCAIGEALKASAKLEADQHLLMVADLYVLIEEWNRELPRFPLRVDRFLGTPQTRGVAWYCSIHEEYLAGPTPFVQVSMIEESGRLAESFGSLFVESTQRVLGILASQELSFAQFHVPSDLTKAPPRRKLLDDVLRDRPEALPQLVATGEKAIDAYRLFLADAVQLGCSLATSMGR